jgi:hypothetical protein
MKHIRIVLVSTLALIAMSLVVVFAPPSDQAAADPTAVPHFRTADIRVRITEEPEISRNQDPVFVQLDQGTIPSEVSFLTVLTDENCQPDVDGVSHCLNRVEFETADGVQQAALRHHHKMAEEPCLAPGQTLELVS